LEVWGQPGRDAWYDSLSWRSYGAVSNLQTVRDISTTLGTYAARAESKGRNTGRQGRMTELPSSSRGSNVSEHEISRALLLPDELMSDLDSRARVTLVRGSRPILHAAAIGSMRPEIAAVLNHRSAA